MLGGLRLTPLLLIKLGVLLVVALWLSNIASNFVESRITQSSDLTPSIQVLLVKMIRLALMIFAVAVVMSAVGINLSALAIFSGAAGVGIGFGLQKIVANFISGIILLADKSVKPGDLVTIGDSSGRISAMKTRYISVAAGDGREFLIPNEDLVTQKVTNWTYTDKNTLVKVNFGTNYDADPRLVCKLAIEIAAAAPRAIKSKPPNCILVEFAEAGMKFSLTFWIADPDGMDNVKSEVMLSLWDAFKREGIRVPYPVREIRDPRRRAAGRDHGGGSELTPMHPVQTPRDAQASPVPAMPGDSAQPWLALIAPIIKLGLQSAIPAPARQNMIRP